MIQAAWSKSSNSPGEPEIEIKRAALLAWEGHLTSVEYMEIRNKSITDIPQDQMKMLASIVTGIVSINNMTHTDQLGSILASIKCPELSLWNMYLSDTETRAVITAMRDRVQTVYLHDITLDIEELTQYDGQGCCSELQVWDDTKRRYGGGLGRWAEDIGWTVSQDIDGRCLEMTRE